MKDEREVKLISRRASDIELPERKKRWGKFYLKGKYTLSCKTGLGRYEYPIYLDRIKSGNQCVDVIFQVTSKTWCTAQDCKDLLDALRQEINPQGRIHSEWRTKAKT